MARTKANKRGNTRGQHSFAQIPSASIPRSAFNRSCGLKTTFDAGDLVPIFCDEALPGDTFNMRVSTFARMATPLHPVMDTLHLDLFFFAVPIRLIWDNFQKFMGEQTDPGDSTDYLVPKVTTPGGGWSELSISDYMGIPVGVADLDVSALWHRAYNLIYAEWFRDQNLVDSPPLNTDDGPDDPADYDILKRGKRHDYFTSCLPWPQKGDAVTLPLGDTAPLGGHADLVANPTYAFPEWDDATNSPQNWTDLHMVVKGGLSLGLSDETNLTAGDALKWGDNIGLHASMADTPAQGTAAYADLSQATAATINTIRQAFQLQKLYERDARGGTRYTEIVRSHFGVISPDSRLQRPEYLGGGHAPITVTPIPQTSATEAGSPQANLAAYVTSTHTGRGFVKSFTEHSIILGLACVRADLNYQQGLPRMFSRETRYDYYWPSFAHLGEQAVLNKEIYAQGIAADEDVFGYQERYAEYRYKPSTITGRMRSTAASSLDTWHLAQEFSALPALNQSFIEEAPPIDRVVAVTTEPEFLFDAYFEYKCVRPMPTFGVPGLIDHF